MIGANWSGKIEERGRLPHVVMLRANLGADARLALVRLYGLHIVFTMLCAYDAPTRKRASGMLSWLRRREKLERIDAEAEALIGELGVEAYAEARRRGI
jgi:hypothetical protein